MLRAIILGAAAGGGVPQWNCGCAVCSAARLHAPELRRTQASVAVSGDGEHWFLINASPDLRQQLVDTKALHPQPSQLRHSPIAGVILTNGEVDAIAGLLSLREGWPFGIYAHRRVLETLERNSIFNVLDRQRVPRRSFNPDEAFEPALPGGSASGLRVTAFAVPGKRAWYLEGEAGVEDDEGDTVGLEISNIESTARIVFVAACAKVTPALKDRMRGADLLLFDGTLWRHDELIALGLGRKTGGDMGHLAMSGPEGSLATLEGLQAGQKLFLHINNSNPALLPLSDERKAVERAGWIIPSDGMEFTL